ncbi:serine hydrolase [Galbibacter sp. EGI 63066]|uniref:serine hydrolase domain-containing protein n=1 Tax=Galbibacter sp. EGI 63066 TaxID=2993559 RepID=UPI0022489D99|nr:serine hydrolase domain-containing protein [Galbibacter sp. EGI 63066]MCX2681417.1 serine hydrolase [Galbibacter sp. EGI 63066]
MNKLSILIITLAISSCSFYNSSTDKKKQLNNEQNRIQQIVNKEVSEFIKQPEFSALSGALYVNGKTYQFHFGRLINGIKPNNKTLYEIGSITKTYVGLLLSQAIYDHKLNLDDNIEIYLNGKYPNLKLDNNRPITLRNLITHTAGLPMIINCNKKGQTIEEQLSCFKTFTKEDFFEQLKKVKLVDKSGKNYHYSNAGIQLVGSILENIYQSPFKSLLKKFVFSRSKEQNTYIKTNDSLNNRIVIGKNNKGEKMPLENGGYEFAGGLKSSTESMLKYIKMYLESNDPVVKQSMNLLAGNEKYGRAYAWNTFEFDQPNKMLYHNGGTFGESSWIALYPDKKIGVFLVTNVMTEDSQGKLNELSNKIIERIFEGNDD